MTFRFALVLALAIALSPAVPFGAAATDPAPRTITITAGDDMKFGVTEIRAKRGERLRVVLTSTGTMPKIAMAHNVVVLSKGTDADAFVNASAMARGTAFVAPAFKPQVVAATGLAGAGEKVEVTFAVPSVPGRYDFVCSFPGHYAAGMRGVLIVR